MSSEQDPKEIPVDGAPSQSDAGENIAGTSAQAKPEGIPLRMPMPEFDYESDPSEDDDEDAESYVPISQRPEWKDVKPIPQDDGPYQVVAIKYSDKFRETFDYFRAVLAHNEISERAFNLTTECIRLNPSNFTVWYYRRRLILGLNYDYNEENNYIRHVVMKNPKNYQVWEHYKTVIEQLRSAVDVEKKLEVAQAIVDDAKTFIRSCLKSDVKNYHAWQLLQWMTKKWNAWNGELEYCDLLLEDDIRNNSAWNHRFYILQNTTDFNEDVIDKEIQYTMNMISKASKNESAWNFLSGLLDRSTKAENPELEAFCNRLAEDKETKCNFLVAFQIKYYSKKLAVIRDQAKQDNSTTKDHLKELYGLVLQLYQTLANELDSFRKNFWNFEEKLFVGTFEQSCC